MEYEYDNNVLPNECELTLFELIILHFKINDCISNFWIISNCCTKRVKLNDPSALMFDLGHSS